MNTLARIADEACEYAANLEAERYAGVDAARHVEDAARLVRAAEIIKMFFAQRAVDSGGWKQVTHAATPQQWLADVSGSSESAAYDTLSTAGRLSECPKTEEKLRAGELSLAQATQVTAGAIVDPSAESRLLRTAKYGIKKLRAEKDRVVAAATDEQRAHQLAHEERHVRTWTRGAATHGSFSGPNEEIDKILRALEPLTEKRFEKARQAPEHEGRDAYRFDALVELVTEPAATSDGKRAEPVVRVRVDSTALLRGHTEPGELCEIPGLGPVPVAHAREVLSHGLLELVLTDGVDVQTVVSTTRHIPKPLRIAISERDGGQCQVDICDRTIATERHHIVAFAEGGVTTYEILVTVCPDHHYLVHHAGYTIIENGDGSYTLRAPPHTDAA